MARKKAVKEVEPEVDTNKINRMQFIDVLTKVKPGIADKEIIEQSSHFIFEPDRVWSFNDEIAINQTFNSGLKGAVKADEFYKLLNKLEDETITITINEGGFCVQGEKITANIKIDPDVKLQTVSIPDIKAKGWEVLPDEFCSSLSVCLFSASKNMIRPALTCLYVTGDKVVSTDTFRATKHTMQGSISTELLIPASSAKELIKYNVVKIFTGNKGWLHFTNDESTIFSCRTFADIEFPKQIWDFFNVEGEKIILPDTFDKVIDRVSTLITADFDLDRFVTLNIEKNILECKSKGSYGSISEKIKIDYKGEVISIKIHPGFLTAIINKLNEVIIGQDRVLFQGDNFEHAICLSS